MPRTCSGSSLSLLADDDLFGSAAQDRLRAKAPLADRLRPRNLDEVVGQNHLLGPGRPLRALITTDRLSSVILWGPPGTGKTTLAKVVANTTDKAFEELSAVSATVRDVREVLERADRRLGEHDTGTILFLDEVHRFNKAQQDSLLPAVERGLIVLIGATTENPHFEVNPPLLSRSTLLRLETLDPQATEELLGRGLANEGATAESEALKLLAERSDGDGRRALTSLEVAVALASVRSQGPDGHTSGSEGVHVTVEDVDAALGTAVQRYGRDEHYDVISAFIKSVRGSDPDAALHYLARMLEAGEDARFIARRLVILASEDVGMADSRGLLVASAAAHAVEYVGLPEAQLNLAHATVWLSTAPKSNRVTLALADAAAEVREGRSGTVPPHLRDAHYSGATSLGHGQGYEYPHDDAQGWVAQQYLPDPLVGHRYYRPGPHGAEEEIGAMLDERRGPEEPF